MNCKFIAYKLSIKCLATSSIVLLYFSTLKNFNNSENLIQ